MCSFDYQGTQWNRGKGHKGWIRGSLPCLFWQLFCRSLVARSWRRNADRKPFHSVSHWNSKGKASLAPSPAKPSLYTELHLASCYFLFKLYTLKKKHSVLNSRPANDGTFNTALKHRKSLGKPRSGAAGGVQESQGGCRCRWLPNLWQTCIRRANLLTAATGPGAA